MSSEFETNRSGRERSKEVKEAGQESEDNKELQIAAAMERADFLSKEVKTNQNQVQNLILHIQAVAQAIKELRAALDLPMVTSQDASLQEDERRISELQKRIEEYKSELVNMKDQLVQEQIKDLLKKNSQLNIESATEQAREKVMKMYAELGI